MIAYFALFALVAGASCTSIVHPCPCSDKIYKVALDSCGPDGVDLPILNAPPRQTPVYQKPIIKLPACIPAPKTISNCCKCVKTVLKPQVIQQVITVPHVQPYLETSHRPIIEKITYNAVPCNCPSIANCPRSVQFVEDK